MHAACFVCFNEVAPDLLWAVITWEEDETYWFSEDLKPKLGEGKVQWIFSTDRPSVQAPAIS